MISTWTYPYSRGLATVVALHTIAFVGLYPKNNSNNVIAQVRPSAQPDESTKTRLQVIVKGILAAWDPVDVVCLGEDHGSKNDSDLRITLIEHPDFVRKVRVIMIESANVAHQDILDRFIIEGEGMPREKLRTVWADAAGHEVWDAPIYEAFLRTGRNVNLKLPRECAYMC